MKYFHGFRADLSLVVGGLAVAGALLAQQSPAPSAAAAANSASTPAAASAPVQPEQLPQSFAVLPGTADDDDAPLRLRTTTRRVVVDVVVTGPDGKPVPGLAQKDFTVFEDRKQQSVRAFEVHTPEADSSLLPPAPTQLPNHTFVNLEQTPASGPPVVVLLDDLNTPVTDQGYAHQQIVRFLAQKPASTEVAIFVLGDNLSLVQGFTTDTGKLLAAMRSKAAGLRMPSASEDVMKAQITLAAFLEMGKFLATLDGRKNLLWFSESFNMLVLPSAQDAERGLMVMNGESVNSNPVSGATATAGDLMPTAAMIGGSQASSSGFSHEIGDMSVLREQMRKAAIALAVSQTAVYPIDVRGLAIDPGMTAEQTTPANLATLPNGQAGTPGIPTAPGMPPASVQSHNDFMQSLEGAQATMDEVAQATGGQAFVNTNGLAIAAGQAVRNGAAYYTLVYAPTNMNFDGGLRSIHVTLDKPGCHLAYRSAYYAVDASSVSPDAIESDSLAAAMVHGGPEAQGLLFKAQIDPDGVPAMAAPDSPLAFQAALNEHKKRKKPQHLSGMVQSYEIRLAILAQQLQFVESPDGRRNASLEIAVYAYAADGRKLGGTRQNLEASLPPAIYARDLYSGMFHNLHVQLPVEAATLRLAIMDPGNHRAGSLEVALPLTPSQQAGGPSPAPPQKN